MLEMMGGLFGAAGSIVSGMMAAEAAEDTNRLNWAINVMNYQQRERERAEAIAFALKQRREQQLGSTDIRGTRTHFIPGRGWVVEGSPEVLALMKLQDAEQKRVLEHDLPMRRKVMDRNYIRGLEDEIQVDKYKRELGNVYQRSDEGIANDLYMAQALALREAGRDSDRRVFTQAMRTGQNSNFADIAGQMAAKNNAAYAKAALDARIAARGAGRREYDDTRKNIANLYNLFATRAGQLPEVNYRPMQLDTGSVDSSSKNALVAGQDALKATMMKGGTLDYMSPNYGWANAVGGGASALASAFRMGGAQQRAYGDVGGFGGTGGSAYNAEYQGNQRYE